MKLRSLLDVNVLVAALDSDHSHHKRAFKFFETSESEQWASCPITQNGCLRILSNPNYSRVRRYPLPILCEKLRELFRVTDHQFWADDISLTDSALFDTSLILGHQQLTDVFLLALAVEKNGRLVTFDQGIFTSAVIGATRENLVVI